MFDRAFVSSFSWQTQPSSFALEMECETGTEALEQLLQHVT